MGRLLGFVVLPAAHQQLSFLHLLLLVCLGNFKRTPFGWSAVETSPVPAARQPAGWDRRHPDDRLLGQWTNRTGSKAKGGRRNGGKNKIRALYLLLPPTPGRRRTPGDGPRRLASDGRRESTALRPRAFFFSSARKGNGDSLNFSAILLQEHNRRGFFVLFCFLNTAHVFHSYQ